jgi:hypothetical protein
MAFHTPIQMIPLVLDRTNLQNIIQFGVISIILSLLSSKITRFKVDFT